MKKYLKADLMILKASSARADGKLIVPSAMMFKRGQRTTIDKATYFQTLYPCCRANCNGLYARERGDENFRCVCGDESTGDDLGIVMDLEHPDYDYFLAARNAEIFALSIKFLLKYERTKHRGRKAVPHA